MNRIIVSLGVMLSVSACAGETKTTEDPYTVAADELEALAAALEDEMTDEDAADAISDESIGMVSDAVKRGRRGHHRGRMGHGHRRGRADLLLWYGDLEAIQACRDLADTCTDDDACRSDVMDCVRNVFMDAFAALCEEKVAMCEADDAPERACGRITAVCSGDAGAFGHHFGGDHRGSRPDGGDFKSISRTRDHDGPADGGVSFGSRGDHDDDGQRSHGDWDDDDEGDDALADAGMN